MKYKQYTHGIHLLTFSTYSIEQKISKDIIKTHFQYYHFGHSPKVLNHMITKRNIVQTILEVNSFCGHAIAKRLNKRKS